MSRKFRIGYVFNDIKRAHTMGYRIVVSVGSSKLLVKSCQD